MTDQLVQEIATIPMRLVQVVPISHNQRVFRFESVDRRNDDRLYLEATDEELRDAADQVHPYAEFATGDLFHVTLSRVVPKHD